MRIHQVKPLALKAQLLEFEPKNPPKMVGPMVCISNLRAASVSWEVETESPGNSQVSQPGVHSTEGTRDSASRR